MPILFPIVAYAAIWLTSLTFVRGFRYSLLIAAIIWSLVLVAITELLSVFTAVTFGGLVACWSIVIIAGIIFFITRLRLLTNRYADYLFENEDHRRQVRIAFKALGYGNIVLLIHMFPALKLFYRNMLALWTDSGS